jgi:hypothetical protein
VHSLEQSLPGELPVSAYDEVSILWFIQVTQ